MKVAFPSFAFRYKIHWVFKGGRRESSVVEETRTRIQGYYGTGKIMEKGFKVKNEESRIERSIDGISIDGRRCNASRSRPARSTSPLVYLCSCSLRGIRFKFDPLRHSFLSFLFSFSPSLSLDPWGQAHCSCIIAIAPREKLNLKLIDCRNEWYANCHTILSSLVSPSNVNDKTCLAPREKNGTRVPRIVEFLTIFNSLDYI